LLTIKNIKKVDRINLLQSLYSEPQTQQAESLWKKHMRGCSKSSYKLWQAVKVALTIPVLGKFLSRCLSFLKLIMVSEDRDRGYSVSKIPPAGECLH